MIPNEEVCKAKSKGHEAKSKRQRWYYFSDKKLSSLLRGITSKHQRDFYCLNCFHSFATEKRFELHKRVRENKDFCNVIIPAN